MKWVAMQHWMPHFFFIKWLLTSQSPLWSIHCYAFWRQEKKRHSTIIFILMKWSIYFLPWSILVLFSLFEHTSCPSFITGFPFVSLSNPILSSSQSHSTSPTCSSFTWDIIYNAYTTLPTDRLFHCCTWECKKTRKKNALGQRKQRTWVLGGDF